MGCDSFGRYLADKNDYLWINKDPTTENEDDNFGLYGPSLKVLQTIMTSKSLLDSAGQLIH